MPTTHWKLPVRPDICSQLRYFAPKTSVLSFPPFVSPGWSSEPRRGAEIPTWSGLTTSRRRPACHPESGHTGMRDLLLLLSPLATSHQSRVTALPDPSLTLLPL